MTPPPEPEDEEYRPRLIRSYTLTAGRTASKVELAMEATLRLQAGAEAPVLSPSAAQVLEVCDRRSVAEVSAVVPPVPLLGTLPVSPPAGEAGASAGQPFPVPAAIGQASAASSRPSPSKSPIAGRLPPDVVV